MAENFIAEAFSLLAISLIFIALRIYSRWSSVGFRQLAADDYLMVVAGVSTLFPFLDLYRTESRTNSCYTQPRRWPHIVWAHIGTDSRTTA